MCTTENSNCITLKFNKLGISFNNITIFIFNGGISTFCYLNMLILYHHIMAIKRKITQKRGKSNKMNNNEFQLLNTTLNPFSTKAGRIDDFATQSGNNASKAKNFIKTPIHRKPISNRKSH